MAPDQIFLFDQQAFADGFVEGCYLHDRRRHVSLPVMVWFGPAPDLDQRGDHALLRDVPGLDRSPRWNIDLAGVLLEDDRFPDAMAKPEDVWPRCQRSPVGRNEIRYRLARILHAREHDPNDPFGHVRGRVDYLTASLPY